MPEDKVPRMHGPLANLSYSADTLDLQDKTSPTAQDHTRQPQHPSPLGIGPPAPHQEASLRHAENDRHSEESHLQNGSWSESNTLREDPGSDDERTIVNSANGDQNLQQDEQAVRLNGGMTGSGEDGEMQDADEEDMDDDMMDKISSSPSIDDGGYSLTFLTTNQPERSDTTAPMHTPTQSPAASLSSCVDSSPFTTTPIHFPISVAVAQRPYDVWAGGVETISRSSHRSSPIPFLSQSTPPKTHKNTSMNHHRGEYSWAPDDDNSTTDDIGPILELEVSPRSGHLLKVEGRLQSIRQDSQTSLFSDLDEEELQAMLQPVRSPVCELLEDPLDQGQLSEETAPSTEEITEEDSWTTDSDADSWDEEAGEDDNSNDISFSDDPRFVDSGWGGECLREAEDIDFEFVYALHTFVATVEGQANATKGDTMVLLDDSNSYWWLVRVVKDSSIGRNASPLIMCRVNNDPGYLPAEHIETPTERLARLNKHRNIDLSATMLGDTAEKTKNPLKKAMRRRNAKTVQFAPPTFVEASDYDYSSDEGGDEELFGGADPTQNQAQQATAEKAEPEQDDNMKVQPLKVNGTKKETNPASEGETSQESKDESAKSNGDKARTSDEIFDRPLDPKVSRNGTMRNTDSFFKDDNAETRKITLTPNLLRDDSSTSTTGSRERGPSLESLEKNGFADKVKDDKKKKEKKPGMLSGLFKRSKDKKTKGALDSFDSDAEKLSEEFGRNSPQSKEPVDERAPAEQNAPSPQRQPSKGKLQKPQRGRDDSPSKVNKGILKTDSPEPSTVQSPTPKEAPNNAPPSQQSTSTMRLVSPEREEPTKPSVEERVQSPENRSRSNSAASKLNPMNILKSQSDNEPRPEKVKKAKQRIQLDDFDSEEDEKNDPFADPKSTQTPSSQAAEPEPTGRLSESPVHISAADAQPPEKESAPDREHEPDSQQPPGLTADTSSQETPSPVSTPTPDESPSTEAPSKPSLPASRPVGSPSPTLLNSASSIPPPSRPAPVPTKEMETSPPVSSESTSLPAWSDSSLRTYLDDGSDIRDMLLVINDTTGVVPVGRDHPLMSQLFVEETKTVTQLGGELDLLLNNWLETKRKKHKASPLAKPR